MIWTASHPRLSKYVAYGAAVSSLWIVLAVLGFQRPGRSADEPGPASVGDWVSDSNLARSTWDAAPPAVEEHVERWIERFLGPDRSTFIAFLERRGEFAALIEARLAQRGMPRELLYLAMIESGFSPGAVSPVEATGMWQFMDLTARAYGLRVDRWVDERRDPVRATDAALDYLEDLYDRFGSWPLAAAAYNAGPTRVARLVRVARQASDEEVYWKVMRRLPRETRDYVPKILAAWRLGEDPRAFGFRVQSADPFQFERVLVPERTRLKDVADALGVHPSVVRRLNPHFLLGVTPPGSAYVVRVPVGQSHTLVAALAPERDPFSATS